MTTRTIELHGARFAYEDEGEGDALLFIHGGLGDRTMWDDQIPAFAGQYRVIRPDLWGFGESATPPGDFSHHEDLHALLSSLNIQHVHVVALSLGGTIALDLTLAYPDLVRSLALVGSGFRGHAWLEDTVQRLDEADEALESGDIHRGVEMELRLWIDGPRRSPNQVDGTVRERVRIMNARNYENETAGGEPQIPAGNLSDRLSEIRIPTLIVVGEEDIEDMQDIAAMLQTSIQGARKVAVPDAAHHPQMERPQEFNRIILEFLRTQR